MRQASRARRRSDGGFTLVELLVVIAILGILAAVAVFAIGGTTAKSKKAACKSDVAAVQVAADAYAAEKGSQVTGSGQTFIATLKTEGYLRTDPATTGMTISTGTVTVTPAC